MSAAMSTDRDVNHLRAGDRLRQLDGLRGVAVLLVVFLHYIVRTPVAPSTRLLANLPAPLLAAANMAWCGVDLFFVLSGFLIGGIVLDHRGAPNQWRAFYSRRVTRIFPAYFLLLGICLLPLPHIPSPPPGSPSLLIYALFLQNCWPGPDTYPWLVTSWSVAVEEQFYLMAPVIIARASRRGLLLVLFACILGPLVLRLLLGYGVIPFRWNYFAVTPCRIDGPAYGVLGAWVVRDASTRPWLQRHLGGLKALAAVLCTAMLLMSQAYLFPWGDRVLTTVGLSLLELTSLTVILVCVLDGAGLLSRALQTTLLTTPGRYSYFVYLFHTLIFQLAFFASHVVWQRTLVAVSALTVLAYLSGRFFEQPFLRLGHSVRYELPPRPQPNEAIG